jgi:hypothetical protein
MQSETFFSSKNTGLVKGVIFSLISSSLLVMPLLQSEPAFASTSDAGSLTIATTGAFNAQGSTWTYSSVSGVLTVSESSIISASEIQSLLSNGDLTIRAGLITVSSNVEISASALRNLVFSSKDRIKFQDSVSLRLAGGDLTLQANNDDSGSGEVTLGDATNGSARVLISTNGGNIYIGGGSTVSAISSTSSTTSGFADAGTYAEPSGATDPKPPTGVAMYGVDLIAGGGNVVIKGRGSAGSVSSRGIIVGFSSTSATASTFQTSGSGSITMVGDGSRQAGSSNAWGIVMEHSGAAGSPKLSTVNGAITLHSIANNLLPNARGFVIRGQFESTTGNVRVIDYTVNNPASVSAYSGAYMPNGTFSTSGNVTIEANKFIFDSALTISATTAVIQSHGDSFLSTPTLDVIRADRTTNLIIGKETNTSSITISTGKTITVGDVSRSGSLTINAANISISAEISASGVVKLNTSGNVSQTARIIAAALDLQGATTSNFTLTTSTNSIAVFTAGTPSNPVGNISLNNSRSLTIGTVSSSEGVYSAGEIKISTLTGDLNVTKPMSSSKTSGDTIILRADSDEGANNDGDGNIVLSGTGVITIDSGSRALFFSGTRASSSGLVDSVGGEDNAFSPYSSSASVSDLLNVSLSPTGKFAIFRSTTPASISPAPSLSPSSSSSSSPSSSTSSPAAAPTGPTRPYTGPVISDVSSESSVLNEVKVTGLRLSTITQVYTGTQVLKHRFDADGNLYFDVSGLTAGRYRINFWAPESGTTLYEDLTLKLITNTPSTSKVNAGSFRGYVALYALGYEGRRLSAKVGKDWVIVPSIPATASGLYRKVEFTGAGVNVAVRIYIDGVLIRTVNLTTR